MSAIIIAFFLAALTELVVVHYFVAMWNDWVAWILTASSVWVALTIVAQLRTIGWRPHMIHNGDLVLRNGMYDLASISLENISGVEKTSVIPEENEGAFKPLQTSVPVSHNVIVRLTKPCEATLLYGQRRDFETALVFVDDPAAFCEVVVSHSVATT